jgi:hypothetical protein
MDTVMAIGDPITTFDPDSLKRADREREISEVGALPAFDQESGAVNISVRGRYARSG